MKTRAIVASMLAAACLSAHSQLTLNSGDTFTHHFDTLAFITSSNSTDQNIRSLAALTFLVQPGSYQPGESVRFEMFQGDQTSIAFRSDSLSNPLYDFNARNGLPIQISFPNAWQDLNGTIRFTGLSGSVGIESISVSVGIPRGTPQDQTPFDVYGAVVVPEPSVWALALLGTGILWGVRSRLRGQTKK